MQQSVKRFSKYFKFNFFCTNKAMAERAALVQHAAAMEKKHTLEEEEERLRIQVKDSKTKGTLMMMQK